MDSVILFAISSILVILAIRWRMNWGRALRDKQVQDEIERIKKRDAYEKKMKEAEERKKKADTIFVNPEGEAKRGQTFE